MKISENKIQELKAKLPIPSEVQSTYLVVPQLVGEDFLLNNITVEREIYKGICIGWQVKK